MFGGMNRWCWIAVCGMLLFANAHAASFGQPTRVSFVRATESNVAIGDGNGDGRADLAATEGATYPAPHTLSIYFQAGDGSLGSPQRVPLFADGNGILSLKFVDLDKDGIEDIVVGTDHGVATVRLGQPGTPQVSRYQLVSAGCRFMAQGPVDINQDGNPDIVCHGENEWPNQLSVYFGDGNGGFGSAKAYVTEAGSEDGFRGVHTGDVDGDGRPDVVVTAAKSSHFYVFPNDGAGGLEAAVAYAHPVGTSQAFPAAVLVVDIDQDGRNEVVTVDTEEAPNSRLNIYRWGVGGALELSRQIPVHSSTTSLLAGDVGGDGDLDLVLGHWGFASASVLGDHDAGLDTQGRFELPGFGNDVAYTLKQGHANALALGDLDGDGCSDLAAATYSGLTVLYGCQPTFRSMPVVDFDGDGVTDLYWRDKTNGMAWMWLWGDSTAACPNPCPPLVDPTWKASVGDFDGDGASDVFYRATTGQNFIYLKGFYARPAAPVWSPDWEVVGVGDFDGNDRSDLFWRNKRTGQNIIWKNGESAGLAWEVQVPDLNWQVVTVGDFNGDGLDDVFWKHATSGRNIIWWGGKSTQLQEVTRVVNTQWRVFGAGDVNGDGKDDVVWRNVVTGAGIIWHSANYSTQVPIATIPNLDWRILFVGDFNGDRIGDLVWRNERTGANILWPSAQYGQLIHLSKLGTNAYFVH
jgi:FG-GAP-like repeat